MSTDAERYSDWLQIRCDGRPNHYQLLGLKPLEADPERIKAAAQERIRLVRTFQMGPEREAALRIIRELSDAFACLSDAERKRAYDQQLRGAAPPEQREELLTILPDIESTKAAQPAIAPRLPDIPPVVHRPQAAPIPQAAPLPSVDPYVVPLSPLADVASTPQSVARRPLRRKRAGPWMWIAGGAIAVPVVLLLFAFSRGGRNNGKGSVPPNLPVASQSADGARKTPLATIPVTANDGSTAPIAPPAAAARTFSGPLRQIVGHDNELHMVLQNTGGLPPFVEAFAPQAGLREQTATWVCEWDRLPLTDTISVTGTIVPADAAKFRLSPSMPLVQIERVSRTEPADSEAHAAERAKFVDDGLLTLLRYHPPADTEASFAAVFQFVQPGVLRIKPISGKALSLELPFLGANPALFSDYRFPQPVEVTVSVASESTFENLALAGKKIQLLDDPASLVTTEGRKVPAKDWLAVNRQWFAIERDPDAHRGERLELKGRLVAVDRQTQPATLKLENLLLSLDKLDLPYPPNAESRPFLNSLKPGDELLFEAEVKGGMPDRPDLSLTWIARRSEPENKVAFLKPEPLSTPGGLLLEWKGTLPMGRALVAWGPKGKSIATPDRGKAIVLWDASRGTARRTLLGLEETIAGLAWSPDGASLAATDGMRIAVWNVETGFQQGNITPAKDLGDLTVALAMSADGAYLADVCENQIFFCNARTGKTDAKIGGISFGKTLALAFNPIPEKAKICASLHASLGLLISDHGKKKLERVIMSPAYQTPPELAGYLKAAVTNRHPSADGGYRALAWNPEGTQVAAAGSTIEVWDVSKSKTANEIAFTLPPAIPGAAPPPFADPCTAIAWSPDGTLIAAGKRQGAIQIWNVATGQQDLLIPPYDSVASLSFSPDSDRLAVAYENFTTRVWLVRKK